MLQEGLSLRERFSEACPYFSEAYPQSSGMDVLQNCSGLVDLRKSMLRSSIEGFIDSEKPETRELIPAHHAPNGVRKDYQTVQCSPKALTKEAIHDSLAFETPRSLLQRIGEKQDAECLNTASKAGEALLRHLHGGTFIQDKNLCAKELPPPPILRSGQEERSRKETTHSHFTDGLRGWQSGSLDLRASSTTQRLSEEIVCTRMELVMHRDLESRYALHRGEARMQ